MAKALLTLTNGTAVRIEGTPEEIVKLMKLYSDGDVGKAPVRKSARGKKSTGSAKRANDLSAQGEVDIAQIINHIKNCDEAELIESRILDQTGMVNRVLLPLYIVHKYLGDSTGLTTGDISRIMKDLGTPIASQNVSARLSGTASKYVMSGKVRKKGAKDIRYSLTRRGVIYMNDILGDKTDA